jgi:hypothetical protein
MLQVLQLMPDGGLAVVREVHNHFRSAGSQRVEMRDDNGALMGAGGIWGAHGGLMGPLGISPDSVGVVGDVANALGRPEEEVELRMGAEMLNCAVWLPADGGRTLLVGTNSGRIVAFRFS